MKPCVYAIFSHTNPGQVIRLVRTLRTLSPRAHIVVHHDPKHTTLDPIEVKAAGGLIIPDPVPAEWGDFSQVDQHLHTMRWCAANLDFEWFIALTGQTYPIKPLGEFESYLKTSQCDAYVTYFDAYDTAIWPRGEAVRRYHYSYVKVPRFKYWHRAPKWILNKIPDIFRVFNNAQPLLRIFTYPRSLQTRLGWLRLKRPFNRESIKLIAGNQNTNYRRNALAYILEYVDTHPQYAEYFRRTALPDEVFYTTILINSPAFKVKNDNLRHIYWPKNQAANVGVMDMQHWHALDSSPAFFALKFDQYQCPELLDQVDQKLGVNTDGVAP